MNLRPSVVALSLCASSLAAWAAPDVDAAAQACEKALVHSIEQARGREVHDVQFDAGQRRADTDSQAQVDLRGSGRYKRGSASASFTYTCAYDPKTERTSGVLFKDSAPTAAAEGGRAWQPDLSRLSPEACETAVVEVLKDKHPRVDHIVFDAATRRLQPAGPDQRLSGQGRLQRAPGMTAMPFRYGCEFDGRNGQLLRAQAED
jgi:hypothetical protein